MGLTICASKKEFFLIYMNLSAKGGAIGAILDVASWTTLRDRLIDAGTSFLIEPQIRFAGEPGEQHTMFVLDPAGNGLEFKAFADPKQLFARD